MDCLSPTLLCNFTVTCVLVDHKSMSETTSVQLLYKIVNMYTIENKEKS